MKIREYIKKIAEGKDLDEMVKLGEMLEDTLVKLKRYDEDDYDNMEICLYEMAYGKTLTMDMAEDWVTDMEPSSKWDYATTSAVRKQYGVADVDEISFYVVMNMLYSDMSDVLGSGDDVESVKLYIQATRDWLNDEDAVEDKLYNYWKYIAQQYK